MRAGCVSGWWPVANLARGILHAPDGVAVHDHRRRRRCRGSRALLLDRSVILEYHPAPYVSGSVTFTPNNIFDKLIQLSRYFVRM